MIVVIYYPDTTSHLALALTGLGLEKNVYISFLPANERSKAGFRLHNVERDFEHHPATMAILPSEESCGHGLSEQAIYNWWKNDFKPRQESFGWFNNNCASKVYQALCVGQRGSASLGSQLLAEKSRGFCTPGKILTYACNLVKSLFAKFSNTPKQEELFLQYNELKECCDLGKWIRPYDQLLGLYHRMKKYNTNEYSLIINKPFGDAIRHTLNTFRKKINLPKTSLHYKKLLELVSMKDVKDINIDISFEKLQNLANYLCHPNNRKELSPLFADLEKAIKNNLSSLGKYINSFEIGVLQEKERLQNTKAQLRQAIDDEKNPHKKHFQTQADDVVAHLGYGVSRTLL